MCMSRSSCKQFCPPPFLFGGLGLAGRDVKDGIDLGAALVGKGRPCPTRSYPDSQKYKYKIEIVDLFGVDCGSKGQNVRLGELMGAR